MPKTRLSISKPAIIEYFNVLPIKVFRFRQINEILNQNRDNWLLDHSTGIKSFIELFKNTGQLRQIDLKFPSRKELLFAWGNVTNFEIALAVKSASYLTHFTAMYINGLTEQVPKTIYVNFEQSRKAINNGELSQDRIDWAFQQKPRVSNNVANLGQFDIRLLNGMHTGQLGIQDLDSPSTGHIRVTNIERTLIDITVRPFYAGGVFEVLKAYNAANGKLQINKMVSYLRNLKFVYPYHQAIGFYMEKAAVYKSSLIELLREFDFQHDFYLTHNMKKTSYSKRWRIFFPEGL
jgi:hypothetical protein